MANRYSAAGRTGANSAAADGAAAALWNPHGTKSVYVREIWCFNTAATATQFGLIRTSTRGTQTATVTPDADNAFDRRAAPASGAVIDTDYSADPTVQGPHFIRASGPAVVGSGWVFSFPEPIE